MRLSTRNQLTGIITEVNVGAVMASVKVKLDGGQQVVTASITKESVEELGPYPRFPGDCSDQVH